MEDLREFVVKLAERSGRYVSYAEPILDGTLPDGSRVSATMAGDVATRGPTFTIRKFSEKPFSPVEQIEMGTVSPEILAYFWYLVEHGASMLIVGGVATGKTSLLNTVSMFIPPEAKIVSIEDTREIRIPHEHWVAGLARSGFGVPQQGGAKYGEVTLFDLLKESFRQNPDYVIVGEVRGAETYVMFQGMSSGHPSLSTFHAGNVESVIKRLTTPPINLSPSLVEALDVVTVMIHARERGKSARRVKEIAEIVSVDPKTQEVKTNVIYRWDPVNDAYVKVNDSVKLEKFAIARGGTLEDAVNEVQDRRKVIEWLGRVGRKDFIEVSKYINMYVKEKNRLFTLMKETPEIPTKVGTQTGGVSAMQLPPAPVIKARISEEERAERIRERKKQIIALLGMISKGK
jgi:flagellar protein FlaI